MSAPNVPVTGGGSGQAKAIHAYQDYIRVGEGVSKNFGFLRRLAFITTIGVGFGMVWKTWHWNEKRIIAQYYADLAKKEARDEADRQAMIQAKFAELEKELLG